jgi:hypothetical protein
MSYKTIDINESTINNFVNSLRPESSEIRAQVDCGYSYNGKIAILFEIRPIWNNPKEYQHNEFAKIRYYKSRKEWHLYWMRANGRWEPYDPLLSSNYLDKIIAEIKEDKYDCFFG